MIPIPAAVTLTFNSRIGNVKGIDKIDISVALLPPFDAIDETKVNTTLIPRAPKIKPLKKSV